MSWLPWPESIKKRACRYLLQHYLGKFLQERLRLEQLSLDLYSGKGGVENVKLDVYSVNELFDKFHAPVEMISGEVKSISVMIPWSNLLSDNCIVEIKGIHLVVALVHRPEASFSEMPDSLYESLGSMTTSMELAQECFKQEEQTKQSKDSGSMFEGLELFAKTIESVLSRVKIKFSNIELELKHLNGRSNVGIELFIKELQYFDEVTMNASQDASDTPNRDLMSNLLNQATSSSCKRLQISGLDVYMGTWVGEDEVKEITKTKIISCYDKHEVKMRIKHKDQLPAPKIDLTFFVGSCFVFLTPKQVHLILNVLSDLSQPQYGGVGRVESELQMGKVMSNLDEHRDSSDRFYSMSSSTSSYRADLSGSSSSVDSDSYLASDGKKGREQGKVSGLNCVLFQCQFDFSLLVITVLHVDPIAKDASTSAHSFLSLVSSNYFKNAEAGYMNAKLLVDQSIMSGWCDNQDHLRLVASPLHMLLQQKESSSAQSILITTSIGELHFIESLNEDSFSKINRLLTFPTCNTGPCKSMQLAVERTELKQITQTNVKITLAECCCELDISVVDRLNALLTYSGNAQVQQYSLYGHDNQSIFQQVLEDDNIDKAISFDVNILCPNFKLILCFPIPDLRSEMNRKPWFKQSIRKDRIHCILHNLQLATQFVSQDKARYIYRYLKTSCAYNCVAGDEATQFSRSYLAQKQVFLLQIDEIELLYCDVPNRPAKSFLSAKATEESSNNTRSSELDAPYIKVTLLPRQPGGYLNPCEPYVGGGGTDPNSTSMWQNSSMFNPTISPFSRRKVVYDNEEVVMPGNTQEIESFINHATQTALITIDVYLPAVHATIHSKAFLETIYNLVGNDLLLWQPAAPQPFGGTSVHFGSSIYPGSLNPAAGRPFEQTNTKFFSCDSREDSESESSDDSKSRDAPIESNIGNESSVAFTLNIKRGSATAYTQNGQLLVKLVNGSLFYVGCYEGNPLLDYLCIGMEKCQLHYKENGKTGFDLPTLATSDIDPILTPSSIRDLSTGRHSSGESGDKMLTTVIKLNYDKPNLKHCMVTTLVSGAMLHHKFVEEDRNWLKQIMDLFELTDNDVLGYDPPVIITQVHLHFEGCCVEYHPYLPQLTQTNSTLIHPLLTIHSMSLSSNIVADSPTSFFHILLDNASLYLATSTERTSLQDLVRVVEVGLLEVSLKINNATKSTNKGKNRAPLIDLSIYNNKVRVESCADSFAALINIVRTFVDEMESSINKQSPLPDTSIFTPSQSEDNLEPQAMLSSSGSMYEDSVTDLLADAMTDVAHHVPRTLREGNNKTHRNPPTLSITPPILPVQQSVSKCAEPDDTQFCIIEDPAPGSMDDPEIRYISDVSPICYHDNHFPPVLGKLDQLSAPSSFSPPQLRYSVKELTCTWHMYGGCDLPTSKKQGRDKNTLMEIHLSKVRVRHEIFDEESKEDARSVIIVTEFEVRDRLTTSQINKFLYQFHSEASPKQSQANMLTIKLLQYKPEGSHTPAECKLKVSLQPLKLNIDQDTLDFISKFFENLTMELGKEDPAVEQEETNKEPTSPISNRTETEFVEEVQLSNIQKPLFFREIIFSPEVPIRLDYHGKHIDTDQGTMAGLLMGLGQLNCSQLKLKKIVHRHGILGADKLINFLLNEWAADIRKNQLPSILGGVGPLHSVVQFFQGVHDLFVLPVEQYKRDGRVVRGLQRGTSSFGASATMATLELTNKLVWLVQKAAETTYDVVSPPELHSRREKQNWRTLGRHASRHKQPSDMREGFNNALTVVRSGVSDAAYSIARVAQEEHEQKGLTGAVGGVLRHLPPTLVKPVIIASEATSNVLSGMRNQILPDAKREDDQKWKSP